MRATLDSKNTLQPMSWSGVGQTRTDAHFGELEFEQTINRNDFFMEHSQYGSIASEWEKIIQDFGNEKF